MSLKKTFENGYSKFYANEKNVRLPLANKHSSFDSKNKKLISLNLKRTTPKHQSSNDHSKSVFTGVHTVVHKVRTFTKYLEPIKPGLKRTSLIISGSTHSPLKNYLSIFITQGNLK